MKNKILLFLMSCFLILGCSKKRVTEKSCVQTIPESGQTNIGPLMAGVAEGFINVPIGTSMGGFGGRKGGTSPYNKALGASAGFYTRLRVKALSLSNGGETIVIVKLPMIFPSLYLSEKINEKLKTDYGLDLWNNILLTSTHTHSGPARFWRLLEGFGSFGMDETSELVFDRIVGSIVPVIANAVNNMEPARFGYGINQKFDPEDHISRDRACEDDNLYADLSNPDVYFKNNIYKTKDNSLVVLKIEKANGDPMAVVINFGMHSTVFEDENFTEDAAGAVEMKVEDAFGMRGQKLTAMFVQGGAGDVSPAGDWLGHEGTQQLEMLGEETAAKVLALWDSIYTLDSIPMEIVSQRYDISREAIGYTDDEFIDFQGSPYRYGAFGCGASTGAPNVDCADPSTKLIDGDLPCIFNIENLIIDEESRQGFQQFMQTRISAARIGDLFIVTMPGEPRAMFNSQLKQEAKERIGEKDITVFGYAQDHQLYISTNEQWWQGGYEVFMNIWGFKFDRFLIDRGIGLLGQLTTAEKEDNSACEPEFLTYSPFPDEQITPALSNPEPSILSQPDSSYKRFDVVVLEWYGGDPYVDIPLVQLEKENSPQSFTVVRGADLKDYDNTRYYMVTRYKAVPTYSQNRTATERQHIWRVEWEITKDFPEGRYRFNVRGNHYKEADAIPYSFTSDAFYIRPAESLTVKNFTAKWSGTDYVKISFTASYPPNPVVKGQPAGTTTNDNQIAGFRVRDSLSSMNNPLVRTGIAILSVYDSVSKCDQIPASYNPSTGMFEAYYLPSTPGCPESAPVIKIEANSLFDSWSNTNTDVFSAQ